jgi:membrane protein implicated in regulation of membrane protease activity
MEFVPWFWIWLGLAALLYAGEMLTMTFFLLPFALGATAATIGNFLGAELWLQWLLMIVISVVTLLVIRPISKKLTAKSAPEKSGVDRLVGMTGKVIEGISPAGENRARIDREVWNVTTQNGVELQVDSDVRVLRVDGVHLVVETVQ